MENLVARLAAAAVLLAALATGCAAPAGGDSAAPPASAPLTREQSRAVYERFRALEGQWRGASTKGWTDVVTYKTVADGSAVLETSEQAHEGTMMITMIHPDGDRLLLTHYCAAHNQPRLQASRLDGDEVTFTFVDATNLRSRDAGHMDKVLIRFVDDDHMTSRWTWYQDGAEQWMEEIHMERVGSGVAGGGGGG